MSSKLILDASALLAFLQNETGSEIVKPLIADAAMSVVNYNESLIILQKADIDINKASSLIQNSLKEIINFDIEQADIATILYPKVKQQGLSLGDRACIALGIRMQLPIYTADRDWGKLKLTEVDIRLIR